MYMISINEYIIEKLHLNKDIKTVNDDLIDLMVHFDLFDVYDKKYGDDELHKLSDEDKDKIKSELLDFIERNDCHKENAKYYTNRGRKFENPKVGKDYKKDTDALMGITRFIPYEAQPIFKHQSLYFKVNDKHKVVGMYGPYGGVKLCKYN